MGLDERNGETNGRHGGPDQPRDRSAAEPERDESDRPTDRGDDRDEPAPADEPGRPAEAREADDDAEAGAGDDFSEDEDDPNHLPPPPDDGPLHVIPIRHLPLARDARTDARPAEAGPLRATAQARPTSRTWQWVPLAALVSLVTTTVMSILVATALPQTEAAIETLAETITGVDGDQARLEAVEAVLAGPQGESIRWALIGMAVSFVAGLLLAGLVAGFVGRAGALEAGLGTATFAFLSLLFMGGGIGLYMLIPPALAFGIGWLGGKLGLWLRRKRDERLSRERWF